MKLDNLNAHSVEQLKAVHNVALATARESLETAAAARDAIVARCPEYRGSSIGSLGDATRSAYMARTFASTPADLPEAQNRYRGDF